jgi:ABC-2 type transport system ATP-binding protein
MNAIETHNLTHLFGPVTAVDRLNLAVPQGSVYALLGPNGAGKTTVIRMVMNLLPASAGSVKVLGTDSSRLGPAELARIGYVADGMELPEWMTVGQFLSYTRAFYPRWDKALEKKLLQDFELPLTRKLKHLSRGMRMKCALTAALAFHPALLVLDEPFSGLDPVVRDDFLRGLIEVSAQGEWTIFVSSHDIEDIERLTDWIGIIDNGKLRLAEELEALQRRFRRVDVVRLATGGAPPLLDRPKEWLNYEEAGVLTRFIATNYAPEETERRCREIFPNASVTATPMTLREIYVTLARANRNPSN